MSLCAFPCGRMPVCVAAAAAEWTNRNGRILLSLLAQAIFLGARSNEAGRGSEAEAAREREMVDNRLPRHTPRQECRGHYVHSVSILVQVL
jgi:hypothetical protein